MLHTETVSSVELTRFYLDRIQRLNPELNAVIATAPDALAAAAASDTRRRTGALLGPLDGIAVLLKDNIEAVGLPGTAGSRALLGSPPTADAPLVRRLRAAGLVLLGATNLSEWANFRSTASTSGWSAVGGQTRNPHDPARNTSGSSSGSAAAIAAGLAPLAVGTETDGSIVSPAGVCGIVGFKPTVGRVPGAGIVPISSRQDTAGPMARTVADAAALFAVLAGSPPVTAAPVSLAGRRVAVWRPDKVPAEVAAVLDALERALIGAAAVPVAVAGTSSGPFDDTEFDALVAEFAVELPAYLAARPGDHPRTWPQLLAFNRADELELSRFSDEIFGLCEPALAAGGLASQRYLAARSSCDAAATAALAGLLDGCEFALAPTNSPAWPIDYQVPDDYGVLTSSLCAVTGSPSISLPAGSVRGLPVGVSLLGRHGQDEQLLAFAAAVEALLPEPRYPLD
ncbi:MAG: amidase family protein [Jatrophihabitans sp.]